MDTPVNNKPTSLLQSVEKPRKSYRLSWSDMGSTHTFRQDGQRCSKVLYQHVSVLMDSLLRQISYSKQASQEILDLRKKQVTNYGLEVHGIADRLPSVSVVSEGGQPVGRDLILLGQPGDYPSAVQSVTIRGKTTPVSYEGGQIIARHLNFGDTKFVEGQLNFSDGSQLSMHINVITAL